MTSFGILSSYYAGTKSKLF